MIQKRPITNPFPGLRPFETEEYRLFFGREGQADELIARLSLALPRGRRHFWQWQVFVDSCGFDAGIARRNDERRRLRMAHCGDETRRQSDRKSRTELAKKKRFQKQAWACQMKKQKQ